MFRLYKRCSRRPTTTARRRGAGGDRAGDDAVSNKQNAAAIQERNEKLAEKDGAGGEGKLKGIAAIKRNYLGCRIS